MNSWIVLIPPALVLIVALVKRNVILALSTGIISSAIIATNAAPIATIKLIIEKMFNQSHISRIWQGSEAPSNVYTFLFLIMLGIIISLITHTGGITAYSKILKKRLHDKRSVETSSLLLSSCFFIDDYLNSLTVGSIMRPITDQNNIPRAKLAYLIDTMSSPLCILIPASSWVALIITQLRASGISNNPGSLIVSDPFFLYVKSLPFMFYPAILIISVWFVVRKKISFGLMRKQEMEAEKTGNLFGGKPPITSKIEISDSGKGTLLDFISPIALFLSSFIVALLYSGNYIINPQQTFLSALHTANSIYALFLAAAITLLITIPIYLISKKINLKELITIAISGADLMKNSLLVLLLAWTLGELLTTDLQTGNYLANLLLGTLPIALLPVMVFITSAIITATTGSAWGTIAIVTPLAIPAAAGFINAGEAAESLKIIYPVIAALLSGAVAGGHMSPISDSTVMSSTSSGCYHLDHLATQISYIIPPVIGTLSAFIISGIAINYLNSTISSLMAAAIGLTIALAILYLRNQKND